MTTHYLDIRVRPDADFVSAHLMGALFSKLHRRLVEMHTETLGVSFPRHKIKPRDIGDVLRLHADEAGLKTAMESAWLGGMSEYVAISAIKPVPPQVKHRTVSRRQFKTNAARLRRRRMRRHNESEAEAIDRIPESVEQRVPLPFVHVRSASTGQRFSLFIKHGSEQDEAVAGAFNTYGLSGIATVPWF